VILMISYGKTDRGKKRKRNEDSFSISECGDFVSAIVCDGMGGVGGGDVASELAVCVYNDILFKEIGKSCDSLTPQIIKNAMLTAVDEANEAIINRGAKESSLHGMGTTLVSVFVWGGKAYVANVGDSRLYRVAGDKLEQVTKDHSYVQYLLDSGKITAEEAETHPHRNVITKALGASLNVEPDFFAVDAFDAVMLCSDGLINYADKDEIEEIVSSDLTAKKKVHALISAAKNGGGGDNITVILLEKEEDDG